MIARTLTLSGTAGRVAVGALLFFNSNAPGLGVSAADPGAHAPTITLGAWDVGNPFAMRSGTGASIADWELVLRTFCDFGQTHNNDRVAGVKADHTLLGAGVGLAVQVCNPAYLTVRTDLEFGLKDDDQI
jgi:hypothetical protein